jgi:starch phosphorylase
MTGSWYSLEVRPKIPDRLARREPCAHGVAYHEGHAAFLILERCRECVASGLGFDAAWELVASGTVFTTHTPVPAGHDVFSHELVSERSDALARQLGIAFEQFFQLGSSSGSQGGFNMTALALRGSRFHNGVSRIHARVALQMEG